MEMYQLLVLEANSNLKCLYFGCNKISPIEGTDYLILTLNFGRYTCLMNKKGKICQ